MLLKFLSIGIVCVYIRADPVSRQVYSRIWKLISSFGAASLPVLPGLVEGPDHVLGVELGVSREDAAAGDHPVAEPLQTVQYLHCSRSYKARSERTDLPSGKTELDHPLLAGLRLLTDLLRQQTDLDNLVF